MSRRNRCSCLLLSFFGFLFACGGSVERRDDIPLDTNDGRRTTTETAPPTSIALPAIPASCVVDTDCVPAFVGDVCECECTSAAIAARDLEAHQARIEAMRAQCKEQKHCGACRGFTAICEGGACKLLP